MVESEYSGERRFLQIRHDNNCSSAIHGSATAAVRHLGDGLPTVDSGSEIVGESRDPELAVGSLDKGGRGCTQRYVALPYDPPSRRQY